MEQLNFHLLQQVIHNYSESPEIPLPNSSPGMMLIPAICTHQKVDENGDVILNEDGNPVLCGAPGFYRAHLLKSGEAACYECGMWWNERVTVAMFTYYTGIKPERPQIEVYAGSLGFDHIRNCRYDLLVGEDTGVELTAGDIAHGLSNLAIINDESKWPDWLKDIEDNDIGINTETDGEQHESFWVWLELQMIQEADLAESIKDVLEFQYTRGITIGKRLQDLQPSQIESYITSLPEDMKKVLVDEYRKWEHYCKNDRKKQVAIEEKPDWYQMRIPIYGWYEDVDNRFLLFSLQLIEILAKEAGVIEEGEGLHTELLEELGFKWDHTVHFDKVFEKNTLISILKNFILCFFRTLCG
jgi:hypothetical protein